MRISDWSSDVCSSDLERRIVELEAQIFRAGLARRLGPGRPELDARCADPVVGRLLVVALAGADTRLDAKRQGADFAGVDAVFAAGVAANLCHDNLLQVMRCRPMRPRQAVDQAGGGRSRTPRATTQRRTAQAVLLRSEESRVGKEGVLKGRTRLSRYNSKQKNN